MRRTFLGAGVKQRGQVLVRLATAEDDAPLARVYTDAFGPTTPSDVRRRRQRARDEETLVAVVDGEVASCVTIEYKSCLIDGMPVRTDGIAGVATR